MASWTEFEREAPELAREVHARFAARKHATMATLRKDGGPRISGTEVAFTDGELVLGSMPGAVKARDLLRDPRVAVHSPTYEPSADGSAWDGEAKVAGRAVEVPTEDPAHTFHVDIDEVVLTRLGQPVDHLVVESWHDGRGYARRERR